MIGVFDAGVGGLSVVRAIQKALPCNPVLYLADTIRFPYSTKPLSQKLPYSLQVTDFLAEQGVDGIVIACNSIVCFAGEKIRQRVDLPVFDVISSGARSAAAVSETGKIGVLGSVQTGNSPAYPDAVRGINPDAEVHLLGSQLLVYLVEEGTARWPEINPLVRRILAPMNKHLIEDGVDTVVIGCTHFPFMSDAIRQSFDKTIHFVDPADAVAGEIKTRLAEHPEEDDAGNAPVPPIYYVSGRREQFIRNAETYVGPVDPSRVKKVIWPE